MTVIVEEPLDVPESGDDSLLTSCTSADLGGLDAYPQFGKQLVIEKSFILAPSLSVVRGSAQAPDTFCHALLPGIRRIDVR